MAASNPGHATFAMSVTKVISFFSFAAVSVVSSLAFSVDEVSAFDVLVDRFVVLLKLLLLPAANRGKTSPASPSATELRHTAAK